MTAGTTKDIECSVADVALLLRARTYSAGAVNPDNPMAAVAGGELLGTFDDTTRPTGSEVEGEIEVAAIEVRARLGQIPKDEELLAFARRVVALRVAMEIELSYRPEESSVDESAYELFEKRFNDALKALIAALPDTSATQKGVYSIPIRSDAYVRQTS